MRRYATVAAAAFGAAFLLGGGALAQNVRTVPGIYVPDGYCQITVLTSAVNLVTASCSTGSVPAQGIVAEICVSGQAIRYRDDGTAPTASIGIPVAAGTCFQYAGNIAKLSVIQQSATATVDASFYGY